MTAPLPQSVRDARLIERLKMDNTRLRDLSRKMTRNTGMSFEQVVDDFKALLADDSFCAFSFAPKQLPKAKPSSILKPDHAEIATLVLSDWHIGETVRRKDSNGINVYNSVVASNRAYEVIDTFKRIVRMHEHMYRIEKIWVPVLGDMINGSIHQELMLTNDLLDCPSAVLAARLLIMSIIELKTLGIPIELDCTVGNHPRLLPKMPTKRQAHFSYDWIVYVMVQNYFESDPQVAIRIHTGTYGIVGHYDWRFVVEHGIDVKSGGEDAMEQRIRDIFDDPIYRKATGLSGTSLDYVIIGNMHKPKFLERVIVNGTLTGQNELGMAWRLAPIKAQQQAFGVTKHHVTTWHYPIEVTANVSERGDNPLSEYTKMFMKEHGR